MKRLTLSTLAIATALFAAQASAGDRYDRYDDRYDRHARYDDRYDSRHDGRYDRGNAYGRWDTARVVRVERIGGYGRDYGQQCRTRYGGRDDGSDGAVLGAIVGGTLGHQAGKGDGRIAATVAGATIGGLIGHSIDRNDRGDRDRHYVECRSDRDYDRRRDADYRVTYRYDGRLYTTVMPYHPGRSIRVRVDVRPRADYRYGYRY